jgi:hypothetical protein
MPQVMLHRLAEVLDGNRSGRPVLVVMSFTFPYDVAGVFDAARAQEARQLAQSMGGDFSVVGPNPTVADPLRNLFLVCPHDGFFSVAWPRGVFPTAAPRAMCRPDRIGPDSSRVAPPSLPADSIASIQITVIKRGGQRVTYQVPPSTDAIFFRLAALDKFAFPYYAKVLGLDSTAAMRASFVRNLPTIP